MSRPLAVQWNESLQKQRDNIQSSKLRSLCEDLDYGNFRARLQHMHNTLSNRNTTKCLLKLRPVFDRLNDFERAISSIAQIEANPGCLVWGVLQALLRCACNYLTTIEAISEVLYDLTDNLTRMNKYLHLLPSNQVLQGLCCKVYDDYVHCCIAAVKFYKKHPLATLFKSFTLSPQKALQDAHTRINANIDRFEKETRLEVDSRILQNLSSAQPFIGANVPDADIFDVSYRRNEFFHGRETVLENIHTRLQPPKKLRETHSCLIHAMGGMGKTQTALEYVFRYRQHYNAIFWLGAERPSDLAVAYASIATKVKIPSQETLGQGGKIEMVKKWLLTTDTTWLLIFDNVESWNDIMTYWPIVNGSVLVTSQLHSLSQVIRSHIPLEPLAPNEGTDLMLKHLHLEGATLKPEDRRYAHETVTFLGGIPIAIAHTAGVMLDSKMTPKEALDELNTRQGHSIWSSAKPLSTYMYQSRLHQVWDLALDELTDVALDFLFVLAMLHADKIQETMFTKNIPETFSQSSISSKTSFSSIRASLARRQLVQRNVDTNSPYMSIHRSLQLNVRHILNRDHLKRQKVFIQAVAFVRKAFPPQHVTQTPNNDKWCEYEEYQPHILSLKSIYEHVDGIMDAPPEFADMLSDAANYFWELGRFNDAQTMASLAITIYEKMSQPNLMKIASAYTLWGLTAAEEGISKRDVMLRCFSKTMELRKCFVESTPVGGTYQELLLLANSYSDFAWGLIQCGHYQQAESYTKHSVEIKSRLCTEETEPMMFVVAYTKFANIHASRKEYKQAIQLMEKAAFLSEKANGPHASTTWNTQFEWANILLVSGDYVAAIDRHSCVLEQRVRIFGKYGCRTRDSYFAQAVAYFTAQNFDEAAKMLVNALSNLDEYPWLDTSIARAKHLLSQVYTSQHRAEQSRELQAESRQLLLYLMPNPLDYFHQLPRDEMVLFDYMASAKTGRARVSQISVKPFDAEGRGIDPVTVSICPCDVSLPIQKREGRRGKPDGSQD